MLLDVIVSGMSLATWSKDVSLSVIQARTSI